MHKMKFATHAAMAALLAVPMTVAQTKDGWAQLDEIIVTTRKREENIQDVPLSVSAIGIAQINERGIDDIQDVAKFTAGIEFDEGYGAQDNRIVIRGLSPTRGRPNAAFLVDGIDFTGEAVSTAGGGFLVNQRLIDVERIEVVKGPQSALYGRSAFAGAVQYITRTPNMDEFEAEGGFDISDQDQYEVTALASGPINDKLGLLINGLWYDEKGIHENKLTGDELGGREGWGLSATALFQPNDDWSFKLRAAYSEDEFASGAQARVPNNTLVELPDEIVRTSGGPFPGSPFYPDCGPVETGRDGTVTSCLGTPKILTAGTVPDGDDLQIIQSPDPRTGEDYRGTEIETLTVTLVSSWDVDLGTFTSYTGYAHSDSDQFFDGTWDALEPGDYTSLDGAFSWTLPDCEFADCSPVAQEISFRNETELFSQELRFATDFDGPFNFTVGGLYWLEDVSQDEDGATVSPIAFRDPAIVDIQTYDPAARTITTPGALNLLNRVTARDTEHWSIYGKLEWEISEQFKATFEGRYVEEEIDVTGPLCDIAATTALTGIAGADTGTDRDGDGFVDDNIPDGTIDACDPNTFRGPSSTGTVTAAGSLPAGTLSNPVTFGFTAKSNDSFFAPKATLEWTPNDDQLWYLSVAEGIKPGGISTVTAGSFFDPFALTFDAEKLWAYEIGGKTTWADGTLQVNGAVFLQEYTDKQVGVTQRVNGVDVGRIENAGEAEIWGVELDVQWRPREELTLAAGYTWLDAEYTKFESQTGSANEIAKNILAGNGGCLEIIDDQPDVDNDGVDDICLVDKSGNDVEDIPEHTFVGTAEWRQPLANSDIDWFVQGNVVYTSDRYIESNNIVKLDSYVTTDLRAGLSAEKWDLIFYVDNVFDDDTVKTAIDLGSQVATIREGQFPPGPTNGTIASLPDPRIFGIRGKIRF